MKNGKEGIIVITSVESREEADHLARILVESKLAACVQIEKIESFYRWKENVEESEEYRLQIKTLRNRYREVERTLKREHGYDLPEIIALPMLEISSDYRRWLEESVG